MNDATRWWLENTSAGRRTLDRMLPASAIPPATRQQICVEQGHDLLGDGSCRHCGAKPKPLVGRTFRSDLGGYPMTVVDEDARFVYVKRSTDSKRALATARGAQILSRQDFASWTEEVRRQ